MQSQAKRGRGLLVHIYTLVDEIFVLPSEGSIKGEGTFVATLVVDTTSCIVPSVAF